MPALWAVPTQADVMPLMPVPVTVMTVPTGPDVGENDETIGEVMVPPLLLPPLLPLLLLLLLLPPLLLLLPDVVTVKALGLNAQLVPL